MPLGIGRQTVMTGIIMFAVGTIFWALIARFTGFNIAGLL